MSKFPIIIHGNNHDSNRGCQALKISTARILDRFFPESPRIYANVLHDEQTMYLDSAERSNPEIFEMHAQRDMRFYLWAANTIARRLWHIPPYMNVIRRIKKIQRENTGSKVPGLLLSLGGDNWSLDYGDLALHLFTAPFFAACKMGFPTVLWGTSIGPFSSRPRLEKRTCTHLRNMDLILVRESLTEEYLQTQGVTENVRRVCDPAFLLPISEPEHEKTEFYRVLEDGAVGLNFSPLLARYFHLSGGNWRETLRQMFELFCRRVDYPILLIPHVMMEPSVFPNNNDMVFMRELYEELPPNVQHKVFLLDSRHLNSMQIKWILSRLKAFAGCRTHAMIAAYSTGVPAFSIGYSVKSRGIMYDLFGNENWGGHFSELTGTRLADRFIEMLHHADTIRETLLEKIPQCEELAWKSGEYLRETLNARLG